ncbi:hypothetical protein ACFPK9_07950 [Rubritalea spongiae]|uniref:Uncharacterized protein n=1 Tax=Rubritalea spongiae TaxID=430797 RepID=A0ABW5E7H4_9BACT
MDGYDHYTKGLSPYLCGGSKHIAARNKPPTHIAIPFRQAGMTVLSRPAGLMRHKIQKVKK